MLYSSRSAANMYHLHKCFYSQSHINLEKRKSRIYLPSFSTRINWESYLSRVTYQKISSAVAKIILPGTKWWQMDKWCLMLQSCSGGVYRVRAMRPARMLKELSQYFSGRIRANKWDLLIILLLCGSEINSEVQSLIITLRIKVHNQFIPI